MSQADAEIAKAMQARANLQRHLTLDESGEQRLERFVRLQQAAFELLRSSPEGYQHFLKRNMRLRRIQVIDGKWKPVATDRPSAES